VPLALLDLPLAHDPRVEAEARVVDEGASVQLPAVEGRDLTGRDDGDGRVDLERNPRVLREMIERAERHDAEGRT